MKTKTYYTLSLTSIIILTFLLGIISGLISSINILTVKYLELPTVIFDAKDKCVRVDNFKNGDSFTCENVNVTLRHYRTKQE